MFTARKSVINLMHLFINFYNFLLWSLLAALDLQLKILSGLRFQLNSCSETLISSSCVSSFIRWSSCFNKIYYTTLFVASIHTSMRKLCLGLIFFFPSLLLITHIYVFSFFFSAEQEKFP